MTKGVIVLPTYNEKENIKILIPQIFDIAKDIKGWDIQVLVVDDTSPDGTAGAVEELKKKYQKLHLIHGKKEGLGRAYIRGFTHSINTLKPDVVFEMDADLQHPPTLLPRFTQEIDNGADFVIGSRYIKGGSIPSEWALHRKFFSYFANNYVIRLGFMDFSVNDWTSGYRAIRLPFIKKTLHHYTNLDGYTFQMGIVDQALKHHMKIKEIPMVFKDRKVGESKIEIVKFVTDNLLFILRQSSFIKFAIVGLLGALIDFGTAGYLIQKLHMFKPNANAISAECAILFNFFMNNTWSFKHKKIHTRPLATLKSLFKFNLVSSGSIVIQWFGMFLALNVFGDHIVRILSYDVHTWVLYKIGIIACLIIPYSYYMYNKVIWKESK